MIAGQQTLDDTGLQPLLPDQLNLAEGERPEFDEPKHKYYLRGEQIPGVTGVLGILDKPALPWWGMRVGLRAAAEMVRLGYDVASFDLGPLIEGKNDVGDWERVTKELKLTVNHVKEEGGRKGDKAHKQAERYLKTGKAPSLAGLTEKEKGYIQSTARCLVELELEPVGVEVMVWHPELRYAGTFDILARDLDGRLGLLDYKTSKDVYDSHFLQLGAYEGARRALKLVPVEFCAVLHITPDGEWDRDTHWQEMTGDEIDLTIEEWESVFECHQKLERRKARHKKGGRR